MWNMEYTVKAMELRSHLYVQIHMTAFKIISSFTFFALFYSLIRFGTAFHATVRASKKVWKALWKLKDRQISKSDGLAQKIRFSIAVSAAAFFSYFSTHSTAFYVKIYERFDCSILGGFYMLFAIETKSPKREWQENEA